MNPLRMLRNSSRPPQNLVCRRFRTDNSNISGRCTSSIRRAHSDKYLSNPPGLENQKTVSIKLKTSGGGSCQVASIKKHNAWFIIGVGPSRWPCYILSPNPKLHTLPPRLPKPENLKLPPPLNSKPPSPWP